MIMIDSRSVRFGMARPCALRGAGRQRPARKNDARSRCPVMTSRRILDPRPGTVATTVLCAGPRPTADSENEGRTPRPAVGARFGLEDPTPSRGAAEGAGRVAAVVPSGKVRRPPTARHDGFDG